jgi:hypothetical protein
MNFINDERIRLKENNPDSKQYHRIVGTSLLFEDGTRAFVSQITTKLNPVKSFSTHLCRILVSGSYWLIEGP